MYTRSIGLAGFIRYRRTGCDETRPLTGPVRGRGLSHSDQNSGSAVVRWSTGSGASAGSSYW